MSFLKPLLWEEGIVSGLWEPLTCCEPCLEHRSTPGTPARGCGHLGARCRETSADGSTAPRRLFPGCFTGRHPGSEGPPTRPGLSLPSIGLGGGRGEGSRPGLKCPQRGPGKEQGRTPPRDACGALLCAGASHIWNLLHTLGGGDMILWFRSGNRGPEWFVLS